MSLSFEKNIPYDKKKEIEAFFVGLFKTQHCDSIEVETDDDGGLRVSVKKEYDPVKVTFANLQEISEFFHTDKIDIDNEAHPGCETCDNGSSYDVIFTIKEAKL